MIAVWVVFCTEAIISFALKSILPYPDGLDTYSIVLIFIQFVTLCISAIRFGKTNYERFLLFFHIVLWTVLVIRSSLIPFTSNNFEDAYRFHIVAEYKSHGVTPKIYGGNYGGVYTDLQGLIYFFFGPRMYIIEYFGLLCAYSMNEILISILRRFELKRTDYKVAVAFLIISLNSIWNGSIYTREPIIRLIIAISLFFFCQWYDCGKSKYIYIAMLFSAVGAAFHSGVISLALGYSIIYILYDHKHHRFNLNRNNMIKIILVILAFAGLWIFFRHILFGYFERADSLEDVTGQSGIQGRGGSGYKAGFSISNPILGFLINTPIRIIYFLLVPFPWRWRGIIDIVSFFFSSLYYSYGEYLACKVLYKKKKGKYINLVIACLLVVLCGYTIYSWGTSNAGTALRHRDKFLPVYIILLALSLKYKHTDSLATKEERV